MCSDFEYEGKAGYTCKSEYSKEDLGKKFYNNIFYIQFLNERTSTN